MVEICLTCSEPDLQVALNVKNDLETTNAGLSIGLENVFDFYFEEKQHQAKVLFNLETETSNITAWLINDDIFDQNTAWLMDDDEPHISSHHDSKSRGPPTEISVTLKQRDGPLKDLLSSSKKRIMGRIDALKSSTRRQNRGANRKSLPQEKEATRAQ